MFSRRNSEGWPDQTTGSQKGEKAKSFMACLAVHPFSWPLPTDTTFLLLHTFCVRCVHATDDLYGNPTFALRKNHQQSWRTRMYVLTRVVVSWIWENSNNTWGTRLCWYIWCLLITVTERHFVAIFDPCSTRGCGVTPLEDYTYMPLRDHTTAVGWERDREHLGMNVCIAQNSGQVANAE